MGRWAVKPLTHSKQKCKWSKQFREAGTCFRTNHTHGHDPAVPVTGVTQQKCVHTDAGDIYSHDLRYSCNGTLKTKNNKWSTDTYNNPDKSHRLLSQTPDSQGNYLIQLISSSRTGITDLWHWKSEYWWQLVKGGSSVQEIKLYFWIWMETGHRVTHLWKFIHFYT